MEGGDDGEDGEEPPGRPVTVVIPFLDRWEMTESLARALLDNEPARVLLYDSGSSPETRRRAGRFADARPTVDVVDARGWGIHHMWNAGVRAALAPGVAADVAFLNNDLVIGSGFLTGLSAALGTDERIQAVCPNYDERPVHGSPVRLAGICEGRYDGTGGLAGFAFMVRSEWFATGWRFPEDARWWYGDALFTLTVDLAGGWYAMATDVAVEHIGGGAQTGRWNDPAMLAQLQRDREAFVRHARDDLGVIVRPAPLTADLLAGTRPPEARPPGGR